MVLTALRGALAFLSRLPVGGGERAWDAFRRTPVAFTLAGYLLGALVALPFVLPVLGPSTAALYLVALYLVTGVTHADGLADLGDAAAVHGDADSRRDVLKDSATGVGGALALSLMLVTLTLGALGLAGIVPAVAFSLVVAAEVGAKTGMAAIVCLGDPAHEGLGSAFVGETSPSSLVAALVATLPLLALAPRGSVPALATALVAALLTALGVARWARERIGGVSGDVLGAANELGRAVAVHAGVMVWTLW